MMRTSPTSLGHLVRNIVCMRADAEVFDIDADAIVAGMHDDHSLRDGTIAQFPSKPMDSVGLAIGESAGHQIAVAVFANSTRPDDAAVWLRPSFDAQDIGNVRPIRDFVSFGHPTTNTRIHRGVPE